MILQTAFDTSTELQQLAAILSAILLVVLLVVVELAYTEHRWHKIPHLKAYYPFGVVLLLIFLYTVFLHLTRD